MIDEASESRRVKFYGPTDFGIHSQVARVAELAAQFESSMIPQNIVDIIELHNVQLYIASGLLPRSFSDADRAAALAQVPQLRAAVGRYFAEINDGNLSSRLAAEIPYDYRSDLVYLLGRSNAFKRCAGGGMLAALAAVRVSLSQMLVSKKLVDEYDAQLRERLVADALNAEHLVRKYLQADAQTVIYVPNCFTSADAAELLSRYIEDENANPNFIRLIATASDERRLGLEAKIRLKAKRRSEKIVEEFFEENTGIRTGAGVRISETQDEPVEMERDGLVLNISYSKKWLDRTLDYASVLNNFQYLFGFVDGQVLLTLPAYPSELGALERSMMTAGRRDYVIGDVFRSRNMCSLLQMGVYRHYLTSNNIDLEEVVGWFFGTYLVEEFGVLGFSFVPSARTSSYLEKVRHLFPEMEGVANQFKFYAQDGEIDRDLLELASDPVSYDRIPSLLAGKYVHVADCQEIRTVVGLLFSDQSELTYINDELRAHNAYELLSKHSIPYADFHEYQRSAIDHLINLAVLEDTGLRVQIANSAQIFVLRSLFEKEVAAYHRLPLAAQRQVDALEARGWVTRRSALLFGAEASYLNYYLNKAEFSNGPELRNKYLHGSQSMPESEGVHFQTYVIALRILIALVIKINDEFCLSKGRKEDVS